MSCSAARKMIVLKPIVHHTVAMVIAVHASGMLASQLGRIHANAGQEVIEQATGGLEDPPPQHGSGGGRESVGGEEQACGRGCGLGSGR